MTSSKSFEIPRSDTWRVELLDALQHRLDLLGLDLELGVEPGQQVLDVLGEHAVEVDGIHPRTECLADVVERLLPYWHDAIVPDLQTGKTVMIAAHGNSLRALVKHLDDLAEIPLLDRHFDPSFLETRARLRAGDGDFVATCTDPIPGYEGYCEDRLGLGSVTWLRPRPRARTRVAFACWQDRRVRNELLQAIRAGRLRFAGCDERDRWSGRARRNARRPIDQLGGAVGRGEPRMGRRATTVVR